MPLVVGGADQVRAAHDARPRRRRRRCRDHGRGERRVGGAAAGPGHTEEGAVGPVRLHREAAGAGKCSTVPSLILICVSVLQFSASVEHSEKCTISSQFAFKSLI